MKIKLLFFYILLLFGSFSGLSQTELTGVITIINGKEVPKEGIHVHIIGENRDYFTSQDGKYHFKNLEENCYYRIRVLIYGFQAEEFSVITSTKPITRYSVEYQMSCEFDAKRALGDWQDGNAKLFSAPHLYPTTDSIFQAKYNVEYFSTYPLNLDANCTEEYNSKIFELLDLKFGEEWRKEIRPFLIPEN